MRPLPSRAVKGKQELRQSKNLTTGRTADIGSRMNASYNYRLHPCRKCGVCTGREQYRAVHVWTQACQGMTTIIGATTTPILWWKKELLKRAKQKLEC